MEMAILAKDRIYVRILLPPKAPITNSTEPVYELEINGETEAVKQKRDLKNQEKKVDRENNTTKIREEREREREREKCAL